MKPFDIDLAKNGKPVCTRCGLPARIICFDKEGQNLPIVALIKEDCGIEMICTYTTTGRFCGRDYEDSYDLMMVTEKKEGWISIYKGDQGYLGSNIEVTQEEALLRSFHNAIDTVHITWEE